MSVQKQIVIDATNAILGRLASFAAKQSLLGKSVIIVNCNEVVISGKKSNILTEYKIARARGGSSQRGPNFPKIPERIVKRTVRGMLSYKQGRGRSALDRVICYNAVPAEFVEAKKISSGKEKQIKTIKLSEIARLM